MIICGLDECGRGSLAGPLLAGAVVFLSPLQEILSLLPAPLRDSKKLTKIQRHKIYNIRDRLPIIYKTESISVADINTHGISWANKEIFLRLTDKIKADRYLVDGNIKFTEPNIESVIRGDSLHPEIMLASVLAKVERDLLMSTLHLEYPLYHWAKNSGYGTAEHINSLKIHGVSPLHRLVFAKTALSNVH
jgi:ribonuclease HII